MTACSHADLLFDRNVSEHPICTLCGDPVLIVAGAPLHPYRSPDGTRGYTWLQDAQEYGEHCAVHVEIQPGDLNVCLRTKQHFGGSYVQTTARLDPSAAREIGLALLAYAEGARP